MKDLIKKEKHDHKLTNILKFVIFAIVMLAPFIAILSKIVYVSANKNAKDSYYGETIDEEIINPVQNDFVKGEKYYFSWIALAYQEQQEVILNVRLLDSNVFIDESLNERVDTIRIRSQNNATYIFFYEGQEYLTDRDMSVNRNYNGHFIFISKNNVDLIENYQIFYQIEYNKYSYLDNVFYYAIDQSKNEKILNWTKDTTIYNVINTMNNGFGLTSNHILTYLLTYWSTMIAIYIIFDIVIFALTKLTHWLQ